MGIGFGKKLAVLAGATAIFLASPAMANTIALGTLTPNVGTGTGGFIGSPVNPGDHITFALGIPSNVGGSGNVSPPITLGAITFALTSLSAKFYAAGAPNVFLGELVDGQTKTFTNLLAGNYFIDVTGVSANGLGGTYSLSLLSHAAAAPGPAGFLFVGGAAAMMASRRRRQKAKLALA